MADERFYKTVIDLMQNKVEELRAEVQLQKRRLEDKGEQLRDREAQLQELSRQLRDREAQLQELSRQLRDREAQLQELSRQLGDAREQTRRMYDALDAVCRSKTWRIGQFCGRYARSLRIDKVLMRGLDAIEMLVEHGSTHARIIRTEGFRKYVRYSYEYRKRRILRKLGLGGGLTEGDRSRHRGEHDMQRIYSGQLRGILSEHKNTRGIVVFPPTADWNIPLYQRPQHMATHLARKGYLFFYCTEKTVADVVEGFQRIEQNCYLTDQYDLIVTTVRGFVYDLYSTQQSITIESLKKIQAENILVYEYIDHIHEDISGRRLDLLYRRHENIVPDIVIASAQDLYDEMVKRFGPQNVLYLPNAVDYRHFHISKDHAQVPDELRPILGRNHPIIGYYGALANWIDYELINALARLRPEYEVLLIGWDYDKSVIRLEQRENVHYLGTRPYGILPRYAVWFDVAMIPFVTGELADSTSPLKLFEYMALGKPIVTTDMRECKRYRSVMSAADQAEFMTMVDRALGLRNDPGYLAILDEEAKANTWEARAEEYDRAVQTIRRRRGSSGWGVSAGGVRGRVSVVLPVYNQADYLEGAIEAVLNQTYTDVELIIVNDGSTDGVERVLDRYVGHRRVKILSQDNQKLPKALNNGFAYATGEYFTWTSADNIMMSNQIEDLVRELEGNGEIAMVFSDYQAIDDRGAPLNDPSFRPQNQDRGDPSIMRLPSHVTFANLHDSGDNFIGPSFLYRRSVAKIIGDYAHDTFGGEDYDYWLRLNGLFRIQHVDNVLYRYRVHDNTLNARARELNLFENIRKLLERDKARRAFCERPFTVIRVSASSVEETPGDREKVILLFACASRNHPFVKGSIGAPHVVSFCVMERDVDEFALDEEPIRASDYLVTRERDAFGVACSAYPEKTFLITNVEERNDLLEKMANSKLFNRMSGMTYPRRPPSVYCEPRRLRVSLQVDNLDRGGMEQVVHDLATCVNRERFDLSVIVVKSNGATGAKLAARGIKVFVVNEQLGSYAEVLRAHKIDVLNPHFSTFGLDRAKKMDITVIETVHNSYTWLGLSDDEQLRLTSRYVDKYVAVSRQVKNFQRRRFGIPAAKIEVIPNGLNLDGLENDGAPRKFTREGFGYGESDYIFLNVASFSTVKAHKLMVTAMRDLARTHHDMRLIFVGDMPDRKLLEDIRRAIRDYHLDEKVRIMGHVDRSDLCGLYQSADCFVLPSVQEGWSIAVMEAMYFNLPLVVTDVGSARDIIDDGDIGLIIRNPYDDLVGISSADLIDFSEADSFPNLEDLKEAMVHMYRNRDHWKEKAKRGREKVLSRFSLAGMTDAYEKLFVRAWYIDRKTGDGAAESNDTGAASSGTSDRSEKQDIWGMAQKAEREFWVDVSRVGYAGHSPEQFHSVFQRQAMLDALSFLGEDHRFWRDKTVVEVGSGPAGVVEYLHAKEKYAVEPLIEEYRRHYPHLDSSDVVYFGRAVEAGIPLDDECADLVICYNMLDHVVAPDAVIAECSRVTKQGGYLLFQVNVYRDPLLKKGRHKILHPHTFTKESALDTLKGRGFEPYKMSLADEPSGEGEYGFLVAARKTMKV